MKDWESKVEKDSRERSKKYKRQNQEPSKKTKEGELIHADNQLDEEEVAESESLNLEMNMG